MALNDFLQSAKGDFVESRLHDRRHSLKLPRLEVQCMTQLKIWPGIRGFLPQDRVTNSSGHFYYLTPDKTYESRLRFRQRFAQRTVEWIGHYRDSGNEQPTVDYSYSATDTLEGNGKAPVNSGMPAALGDYGPFGGTATVYNRNIIPNWCETTLQSETNTRREWTGNPVTVPGGVWVYVPPPARYIPNTADPGVSFSEELSDEVAFSSVLETCMTRLNARTWDEVPHWGRADYLSYEWTTNEVFDEYRGQFWNVESEDPDDYDGMARDENIADAREHFGGNVVPVSNVDLDPVRGPAFEKLQSFWFYPEWIDTYYHAYNASNVGSNVHGEHRVFAQRMRFRLKNTVAPTHYFIARGVIYTVNETANSRWYGDPGENVVRMHPVVQILEEGDIDADEVVEIPAPYQSAAFKDFLQLGANNLSCGAVCFAILGEDAEDWAERNNVDIVGTADTDIIGADSDLYGTADDDGTL